MKKLIISALAFALISSAPAYAINAEYRAQLEKSGCTEVSTTHGCDIHKTKVQNARHGSFQGQKKLPVPGASARTKYGEITAEGETILAMKSIAAEAYLIERGWRQQADGDWAKAGHLMRIVEEKGVVRNAQLVR